MSNEEKQMLDRVLAEHRYDPSSVIAVMQAVQKTYRYLPQEMLSYIAEKLGISEAKIYGVATFYENFSLEPKGRYVIKVCDGTACHVRKSIPILWFGRENETSMDIEKTLLERGIYKCLVLFTGM